ncbi:MAG: DUF2336 domain-containing protein [Proteobacteria bacterium]|nr:DUF2336 domain-containing protein [Pseudomonadota bacterium]MDA1022360.1 DUF2336 domain-containing protein [Pseudomonadota bacterium]
MTKKQLTQEDVNKLLSDPSPDVRAEMAGKIARDFDAGDLSAKELQLAEEIFHVMVKDAEVRVRQALAVNLKESSKLSHDLAITMAKDVEQVALPILRFSEVLNDQDLIEIIASQSEEKQVAIANRATVSENVSDVLVNTGNEKAVTTLIANDGAKISEQSLQKAVSEMGQKEAVQEAMVNRANLPVTVAERLVTLVSDKLTGALISHHALADDAVTELVLQTRERAILSLSTDSNEGDVKVLVNQLHENDRLSPSIMLRSLCMGDITFFETAVARKADVLVSNARTLIHDSGALGLRTICRKADIPLPQFVAVRAAIDALREMEYDGLDHDRERFSRRMIERLMTQYDDMGVEFEKDDLNYLLDKMSDLPLRTEDDAA